MSKRKRYSGSVCSPFLSRPSKLVVPHGSSHTTPTKASSGSSHTPTKVTLTLQTVRSIVSALLMLLLYTAWHYLIETVLHIPAITADKALFGIDADATDVHHSTAGRWEWCPRQQPRAHTDASPQSSADESTCEVAHGATAHCGRARVGDFYRSSSSSAGVATEEQ